MNRMWSNQYLPETGFVLTTITDNQVISCVAGKFGDFIVVLEHNDCSCVFQPSLSLLVLLLVVQLPSAACVTPRTCCNQLSSSFLAAACVLFFWPGGRLFGRRYPLYPTVHIHAPTIRFLGPLCTKSGHRINLLWGENSSDLIFSYTTTLLLLKYFFL